MKTLFNNSTNTTFSCGMPLTNTSTNASSEEETPTGSYRKGEGTGLNPNSKPLVTNEVTFISNTISNNSLEHSQAFVMPLHQGHIVSPVWSTNTGTDLIQFVFESESLYIHDKVDYEELNEIFREYIYTKQDVDNKRKSSINLKLHELFIPSNQIPLIYLSMKGISNFVILSCFSKYIVYFILIITRTRIRFFYLILRIN